MKRAPGKNQDLHGSVPESSPVALLLVDVINDMAFEGAEARVRQAVPMAHRIAALKRRARAAKIPAVYINDNFGRWQSDFRKLVDHVLEDGVAGNICILFSANDAYMRDYDLVVPSDCTVSNTPGKTTTRCSRSRKSSRATSRRRTSSICGS
jgi:nicotinamidase-related amidase